MRKIFMVFLFVFSLACGSIFAFKGVSQEQSQDSKFISKSCIQLAFSYEENDSGSSDDEPVVKQKSNKKTSYQEDNYDEVNSEKDDNLAPISQPNEVNNTEKTENLNTDIKWNIEAHIGYTTAAMDDFNASVSDHINYLKAEYVTLDPLVVSTHNRTPLNGAFIISADAGFSPLTGLIVGPKISLFYCSLTTFIITSQFYSYGQTLITTETFNTTLLSLMGGASYSFTLPDSSTSIGIAAYAGYGMSNATMNVAVDDGTENQNVDIPIRGGTFLAEFTGNIAFTVSPNTLFKLSSGYRIAHVPYMLFSRDVSNSFFGIDKKENETFQMDGKTITFDYSGLVVTAGIEYKF